MVLGAIVLAVLADPGPRDELPTIEWNAPASCPPASALANALRAWLRAPIEDPVRVRADVVAKDGRFVAELAVETAWGASRRHIEADECTSIADTTVLITAIAADPLAITAHEPIPAVLAPPPAIDTVAPPPVLPPAPAHDTDTDDRMDDDVPPGVVVEPTIRGPDRRPPPRGIVRIEGAFGLGVVPAPSGGVGGALGVQWRHLEIGLAAMWWPRRATAPTATGASARVGLVTIGVYACGFLGVRAWAVGLCGAVDPGAMTGRGRDTGSPQSKTVPWVGLALGPRLRWSPHPRIGLVAGLEGLAVAHRARFVIENEGEVYRSGIAGFRARLGVEVRWP
jgi:hypothetical protein